jgi:protocatechuate 3,4-dioxygenase beta subunit
MILGVKERYMMLRFKTLLGFLAMLSLSSCGGGDSISREGTTGSTGGTTVTRSMQLLFTDKLTNTVSDELSESTPLTLTTSAIDSNGNPVSSTLITYRFEPEGLAIFNNDSGTARTNTDGEATIDILVGLNSGAGQIVATLNSGETATTTFNSAGTVGGVDDTVTRSIELVLTDKLTGEVSAELSQASPLQLTASAIDSNGDPVTAELITYSFQPEGLAIFGNDSGTARTGSDGEAIIDILVGNDSGAGQITATLSTGETATATFNSAGITGGGDGTVTQSIQLIFTDNLTGTVSDELSEATPLILTSSVSDSNGNPVTSSLITYTFEPEGLAIFGNDSGTARTGSDGEATIDILVGENSGAGQITATLSSGETATTTFNSAGTTGDDTVTRNILLEFTDSLTDTVSAELSEATPLTLTASIIDSNGNPVSSSLITYTFQPEGLAIFGNDSGTASTDSNGVAIIDILVGNNSGAGQITATLSSGEMVTTTFNSAGTTQVGLIPASLDLFASSIQLASSGSESIELIALVKDANNVLLEGIDVTFSADADASLQVTQGTTGPDGIARATLNTQVNKQNRTIQVTALTGTFSETLDIEVVGTQIVVNGPPSVILGATAEFTIFLTDSSGDGIANQTVQISSLNGNDFDSAELITDAEGQTTFNYTANNSGLDSITALALNASGNLSLSVQQDQFSFTNVLDEDIPLTDPARTLELTWLKDNSPFANGAITLTSTRGTLSASNVTTGADGIASFQIESNNAGKAVVSAQGVDLDGNIVNANIEIEFIATDVDNIILSASPNSIGPAQQKSTITAVLRDSGGNLVKGKTVNFNANDVSGGQISPASAVTDSNGLASTVYTSLNVTTQNGIEVIATEPESGISATTFLTVADRAQFISIGTGNLIEAPDETSYLKKFTVFVTDANSNPVSNVELTITGTPVKNNELLEPNAEPGDPNHNVIRPAFYKGYWTAVPNTAEFEFWGAVHTVGCSNEDIDGDGIEDPNEDTNGDGGLTPANIVSIDGNVVTDENGQAIIELRYAKTFAAWGQIKITASTPVSGSESQASQFFRLSASAADLREETTPPNSNPFGTGLNLVEDPLNPGTFIDDGANLTCENAL